MSSRRVVSEVYLCALRGAERAHADDRRDLARSPRADVCALPRRAPRDGRYIERLGHFDPMAEPNELVVNLERVDYWIGVGASPSETAAKLIEKARAGAEG